MSALQNRDPNYRHNQESTYSLSKYENSIHYTFFYLQTIILSAVHARCCGNADIIISGVAFEPIITVKTKIIDIYLI